MRRISTVIFIQRTLPVIRAAETMCSLRRRNRSFLYHDHNSPPHVLLRGHTNPVHAFPFYFFNTLRDIIPPSTPRSPKVHFSIHPATVTGNIYVYILHLGDNRTVRPDFKKSIRKTTL